MPDQRKILVYCGVYLAALWVLAVLPFGFVLYEFRTIELCRSIELGWFAATFYGSFFVYPVVIGGFATAALYLPLVTAVTLVGSYRTAVWVLLTFYICTTAAISYLEFFRSPHALFEFARGILDAHPNVITGLRRACEGQSYPGYVADLNEIIRQGGAYSSYTRWAYYVGFIAQALIQNAIFLVFLVFVFFDKKRIADSAPYMGNSVTFVLGYAVFLSSIWCLFRLTYRHEALMLFNMDNPLRGDYALVLLYAVVLTVFVAYFEFNLEKLAKTISTIGQLAAFVGGVALLELKRSDEAQFFFGSQTSIANAFVLFILFAFMTALALAFLLKPPPPAPQADT